jgi:hypothetical protein
MFDKRGGGAGMPDWDTAPDWAEPVEISEHIAKTMAAMLSRDYPGTTAADIKNQMKLPHGLRDIIGMFTAGSLEDAWEGHAIVVQDGMVRGISEVRG